MQKYPLKIINEGIKGAMELNITQIRTPKEKGNENTIQFIKTHCTKEIDIFARLYQTYLYSYKAAKYKRSLKLTPEGIANAEQKNLKIQFTSEKFKSEN